MRALLVSWPRCVWKENENVLHQDYTRTNETETVVSVVTMQYTEVQSSSDKFYRVLYFITPFIFNQNEWK